MADLRARTTRLVAVETDKASPFAQSLLFRWIAVYMYEGDAPLAERRAAALSLDRDLLRELLGSEELRELLDPRALDEVELELQRLADGRDARRADGVHDLLRDLGPLGDDEIAARAGGDADAMLGASWRTVARSGFAWRVRIGRRGRGRREPPRRARRLAPARRPRRFTTAAELPLDALVARYRPHARSVPIGGDRGPARRGHRPRARGARAARGRGARRPRRVPPRRPRARVVRRRRPPPDPRRSLAALRREVEPVDAAAFGTVPPRVAGSRPPARRRRRPPRGDRAAPGSRDPGVHPRDRRPAGARPRVPPGGSRRAHRQR